MTRFSLATTTEIAARRRTSARRGIAVILVLGMIAMTLAVSYALIRVQASAIRGTSHGELREEARQAALTGISAGLRRMNQSNNWAGADSTLTGTINSKQTYSVTYATGDATIAPGSAEDVKWPFRVTLTSTGYAVDPASSATTTTYKVEAVAEMVPLALSSNPSAWSTMQSYVLYQTGTDDTLIQIPFRVSGAVRLQGSMSSFASSYPLPTAAANEYFTDLNVMRFNGYPDCRPFTGPITLPTFSTSSSVRNWLTSNLGISLTNASGASTSNWSHPGAITSYQLYPDGKSYTVPTLPSTITDATYQADPRTNPAGLFYASGDVTLGNNAVIVGTVISSGKVKFTGTGASIQPYTLPALDGSSTTVQLPAVVAASDVVVNPAAGAVVKGTVVTFAKFQAPAGTQNTQFDLQGKLVCKQVDIQTRTEFNLGSGGWHSIWGMFGGQSTVPYFPVYCNNNSGLNYMPKIIVGPPSGAATTQQWFASGNPVYNVQSGDTGLRWSVLRIRELP